MKKILLSLIAVMTSVFAMADTATFDWSSIKATQSGLTAANTYTQDKITLTFNKGTGSTLPAENQDGSIRMYKGTELNIKAADGYVISKVVFTATTTTYSASNLTYNGTAISDEWTPASKANEINLSATANARFKTIVVTYEAGTATAKKDPALKWSKTSVTMEIGSSFTAPTFSKATTATVTFASDNESVAKVSSEGVITLGDAIGTAVITASAPANDEYEAAKASCTITVYNLNVYKKVNTITSGKTYLLVAVRNDSIMYAYPISSSKTYGSLSVATTKFTGEAPTTLNVKSNYDDSFTITAVEGGYTIQDPDKRYYYQSGTYTTFNAGTDAKVWSCEPQADGTFKFAMNDYIIYWGSGTYKTFGLNKGVSENGALPYLYELSGTTTAINNAAISTTVKKAYKTIENGKVVIVKDGKKYNVAGALLK